MARWIGAVLVVVWAAAPGTAGMFEQGQAKGFVLGLHAKSGEYTYDKELRQIAEMGADSVLVIVTGYQEDVTATTIDHGAVTRERLLDVIHRAHRYGLEVAVLPVVLIRHPKTSKDWRGAIRPTDRAAWFASYAHFITRHAQIAAQAGAEAFSVGSEFVSMEYFTGEWRRIIARVREVYSGTLFYSANWDHYEEVAFWDGLDAVGITSYYTISRKRTPSRREMDKAWRKVKERVLAWQSKIGKRLVFTEVGYPSQKGAAKAPWNYYGSETVDTAVQQLCIEAFLEAWKDAPEVGGIFIFEWWGDGGGEDTGYTPLGKPAEVALRRWLRDR